MNAKMDAAVKYARKGWKVFPCAPNSKVPLIANGGGFKGATDDVGQIEKWWTHHPDANIGVACGAASGIAVIDVDVKDKSKDGFESIRKSGLEIPPTISQRTPSGGMHYVFSIADAEPVGNAQNLNGMVGVDVRGDGGYVIVAPSSINGKQYEWVLDGADMSTFPDCFRPMKRESVFDSLPPVCTAPSTPAIDRARAYLAEIPGAVEHVDGHAKLFWVAQVLVNGFRLSDEDAESLMWNEYNPRCCPPWTRNASTEKEFRHKISQSHLKPNPEAVSIYDAMPENIPDDDPFDFDACVESIRSMVSPTALNTYGSKTVTKVESDTNRLLLPEGLVGDIAQWMNETSGCFQPLFSLGASLTLCGAIMGRKVCDESNGRTNIYCMAIGHSSSGKDHPGDCINRILTAAGAGNILMGRMTSDSAIEKALSVSPVKIAVLDEVGHFFSNINRAGEGSAYLKTIKPTLMELFSSAHKTYIGKEKASGTTSVIDQPCMCLWGVTAPQKLYSGMTIEELQDGWIARNIIFISQSRPQYVMKPSAEVPQTIVETVRAWIARTPGGGTYLTSSPGAVGKPYTVQMDQEARIVFDKFSTHAHQMMIEANRSGKKTEYLWGKAFQNARRISLIVACGRKFDNPVITKYDADYGCDLSEMLITAADKAIAENVSENRWENEKNRIRHIIESAGMDGVSQNELTRRTQWVKGSRERAEYVKDLVESGVVFAVSSGNKDDMRTMKTRYMSKEAYENHKTMEGVEHVEAEE